LKLADLSGLDSKPMGKKSKSAKEPRTIVGLGELLWDMFPDGKQLGGAPANFAYAAYLLGNRGIVASRIGEDSFGSEALEKLSRLGLDASFVQVDPACHTGTVKVQVDAGGQPTFTIAEPAAWDFLRWKIAWRTLAQQADAVCFGSLAQRSSGSRKTIRAFLQGVRPGAARIFDVNLRQRFYSAEVISESMKLADIVKLNHEELPRVMEILGLDRGDEESSARRLLRACSAKLVCVTRGANGSLLVATNRSDRHPGFRVRVADTVGAGDAFTAALVHHFLRGSSLAVMNAAANRMGSWVASEAGATPLPNAELLAQVRAPRS
jgi:fructokinase